MPRRLLPALICATMAACGDAHDQRPATPTILVGAASSLRDVCVVTAPTFEASAGARIQFTFEASSTLARKIAEGVAVDVFVAADAETFARVSPAIDAHGAGPVLENRLALVSRRGATPSVTHPRDLVARGGLIAIARDVVPAGRYARQFLATAGLLESLAPRFVECDNVRAALALVVSGAADWGFVYRTDASASAPSCETSWIDRGEGPVVVYHAGARLDAPRAARDYLEFLRSPAFRDAATRAGFDVP